MTQAQKFKVEVFGQVSESNGKWRVDATFTGDKIGFNTKEFIVSSQVEATNNFRRHLCQVMKIKDSELDLVLPSDFQVQFDKIPKKPAEEKGEPRAAVPRHAAPARQAAEVKRAPPQKVELPAKRGKQSEAVTLFLSKQKADFEKFQKEIGFEHGSVERRPSRPLEAGFTAKRNNIVMELYNQLLQRDDFKLFVAGLDNHPGLSSSFKLDGQFTPTLEVGVSAMQTFLSVRDATFSGFRTGQFDLKTAEALRAYLLK